ncbi:MAG: NAD(P)-dependent oxidoreductase [Caldimonas sp.]
MTHLRIAVLGATGVLGRPVVRRLIERGHTVRAVVRPGAMRLLEPRQRLEQVEGNILEPDSLLTPLVGCDVVLHLATAIPKPGMPMNWSLNDRIRREGTRNLLWAARSAHLRYVQQSVAMLHANPGDAMVDEDSPLQGSPVLDSALEMERLVGESPLPWMILRGGLFYGRGTGLSEKIERLAREGHCTMPLDGGSYVSLVHPDDMAEAVVLAAESSRNREVLNIVDDSPVTWRELLEFIVKQLDVRSPKPRGPRGLSGFRVSNARAKERLGWRPRFPDYRGGWGS